jgi:hypothetical protein
MGVFRHDAMDRHAGIVVDPDHVFSVDVMPALGDEAAGGCRAFGRQDLRDRAQADARDCVVADCRTDQDRRGSAQLRMRIEHMQRGVLLVDDQVFHVRRITACRDPIGEAAYVSGDVTAIEFGGGWRFDPRHCRRRGRGSASPPYRGLARAEKHERGQQTLPDAPGYFPVAEPAPEH